MISDQPVVHLKKVETSSAIVSLRNDGIMEYRVKPLQEYTVKELRETNEAAGILGGGKPYPNLVILTDFFNADAECRKYAATEESNRYTLADAFLVQSVAAKLIGNFYVRFNKPARPSRIFTSAEDAVSWLYTFL
jgi:hypothetical protein